MIDRDRAIMEVLTSIRRAGADFILTYHAMSSRAPRRLIHARQAPPLLGLWSVVAAVVVAAPGCYGQNCSGDFQGYGEDPGQGHMVSGHAGGVELETARLRLSFPRQRGYAFNIPALSGRTPVLITPYLSANELQNQPGANQVIGAGNIATIVNVRPNGVDIINDTCSDYFPAPRHRGAALCRSLRSPRRPTRRGRAQRAR